MEELVARVRAGEKKKNYNYLMTGEVWKKLTSSGNTPLRGPAHHLRVSLNLLSTLIWMKVMTSGLFTQNIGFTASSAQIKHFWTL